MTPNLLKHLNIATFVVLPMERKIACVGPVLRGGNLLKSTKVRYPKEKVECTFNDCQDIEERISITASLLCLVHTQLPVLDPEDSDLKLFQSATCLYIMLWICLCSSFA